MLPSTSGLSMLSIYVIVSLLFVIFAKLEYATVMIAVRLTDEAKSGKVTNYFHENRGKIDMISLIAYIFGFAIFNLIYFSYA